MELGSKTIEHRDRGDSPIGGKEDYINEQQCYLYFMMLGDEIPTSSTLNFKVLITTSGVGSRLGEYTKYTNKSLVAIGAKPAISRIIESYPPDTTFVITLGHFGSLIQDFLIIAYPSQEFEFVNVDNYDRPGSSLGLSMLLAKDYLQCPFIFHA